MARRRSGERSVRRRSRRRRRPWMSLTVRGGRWLLGLMPVRRTRRMASSAAVANIQAQEENGGSREGGVVPRGGGGPPGAGRGGAVEVVGGRRRSRPSGLGPSPFAAAAKTRGPNIFAPSLPLRKDRNPSPTQTRSLSFLSCSSAAAAASSESTRDGGRSETVCGGPDEGSRSQGSPCTSGSGRPSNKFIQKPWCACGEHQKPSIWLATRSPWRQAPAVPVGTSSPRSGAVAATASIAMRRSTSFPSAWKVRYLYCVLLGNGLRPTDR